MAYEGGGSLAALEYACRNVWAITAADFRGKSDIRKNLVNYIGLEEFHGSVYSLFNRYAKIILNLSFICQLVAFFEFFDDNIYGAIFLCNSYAIIYINHKDGVFFGVCTFIYCELYDSYVHDTFIEVSILDSTSLFLDIHVLWRRSTYVSTFPSARTVYGDNFV